MKGAELLRAIEKRFGVTPHDGFISEIYNDGADGNFLVIQTYHSDDEPHYAFFKTATEAAEYVDDRNASLCWILREIINVETGWRITVKRSYSIDAEPFDIAEYQ